MNILEKLGISKQGFLEKLNLSHFSSNDKLSDPAAIKEVITFKLPPLLKVESDTASLTFRSSLNLQHSLQLFNEPGDIDKDGIIGSKEDKEANIILSPAHPILKHAFVFSLTAEANNLIKPLDAGIKKDTSVKTIAYLKHTKNELVRDALLEDIKNLPFAFKLADVEKLEIGEALAIVSHGKLLFSLGFETTDFLASGLNGITEFITLGEDIVLDIDVGAKIGVQFSVSGDYELIFTKISKSNFSLAIKMTAINQASTNAKLGISIGLQNPEFISDYLQKQIDKLLKAVTNMEADDLKTIEQNLKDAPKEDLSSLNLTESEQKNIQTLSNRLNLDENEQTVSGLQKRIEEIRTSITKKVEEWATTKIEAGFAYEYSRIASNSTLLKAHLTKEILEKFHKDLILFNPNPLIEQAINEPDTNKLSIKEYLNEQHIKKLTAWGISMGIGKYKVGSKSSKEIETTEQFKLVNNEKIKKVALKAIKKYEEQGDLGGFGTDYWVAFNANMEEFKEEPTMGDFDFGLAFFLDHREGVLKNSEKEKFRSIMDMAVLWNIIAEKDLENRSQELWELLNTKNGAKDIVFSFRLNFTADAFELLRPDLSNLLTHQKDRNLSLISEAYGKAMPYLENSKFRNNIELRSKAYGKLWHEYFKSEAFIKYPQENGYANYSRFAENYFSTHGDLYLRNKEGKYISPNIAGENLFFGGIIRVNKPAIKIKKFMNGLEYLLFAINYNDKNYEKKIKRAFGEMQGAWTQQYNIKALGVYFVDLANIKGIQDKIESHLEIRYTNKENKEKVVLIKKKS